MSRDLPTVRPPQPGETAHAWADEGPPLRNSTSESRHTFLDCPHGKGDVILDVVHVRSGTLDVPRNIYSPLGHAWYARCPKCGWTSDDYPNEWGLREAVEKVRSEP